MVSLQLLQLFSLSRLALKLLLEINMSHEFPMRDLDFLPNHPNSRWPRLKRCPTIFSRFDFWFSILLFSTKRNNGAHSMQLSHGIDYEAEWNLRRMSGITKGSILEEVSPYAVVPLYYDTTTSSDGAVAIVSKCRIDTDPTRVPGLEDLPRFNVCQIWHQNHANHIFDTPEIKKFLRRARRMASSSSDNVVASWQILCILAILRVVKDNACNMTDTKQTNSHQKTSEFTQQSTGTDKLVSQWWSPLLLEHYDDDKERKMIPNDDCDDDDGSLLVELWPLIREYIPWLACQRLYRRIQNRLHVLTIAHPLKAWAQTTLFKLTDDEFGKSWRIFQKASVKPQTSLG